MDRKIDIINFDEHKKVQEAIASGPHGEKIKMLTLEEDVHIDGEIKKTENLMEGSHVKSTHHRHQPQPQLQLQLQPHLQAIGVGETSGSTHAKT